MRQKSTKIHFKLAIYFWAWDPPLNVVYIPNETTLEISIISFESRFKWREFFSLGVLLSTIPLNVGNFWLESVQVLCVLLQFLKFLCVSALACLEITAWFCPLGFVILSLLLCSSCFCSA